MSSEGATINIFKEARELAGLDVVKAAKVVDDPLCNAVTIPKVESVLNPYPLPRWAHIYGFCHPVQVARQPLKHQAF